MILLHPKLFQQGLLPRMPSSPHEVVGRVFILEIWLWIASLPGHHIKPAVFCAATKYGGVGQGSGKKKDITHLGPQLGVGNFHCRHW